MIFRTSFPYLICTFLAAASTSPLRAAGDSFADADARARKIVSQMTLDEKISQMHGTQKKGIFRIVTGIPHLGIPDLLVTNGPAGFGPAGPGHQSPATALPAPISLASTWDTDAAREYGVIEAGEAADFGNTFFEAPDINIARVPQNGRTFEAYGEDPFLIGRLAVANIQGIQSAGIIANVKHYAVNNQENHRLTINAVVDERTLREIYLPAFEASVKEGQVASVMGAYNRLNGPYCCENDILMNQILRKDWAFKGFVTSDFGAVHSTAGTVLYGVDVEMPGDKYLGAPLKAAVDAGQVPVTVIDDHLICRFRTMMLMGVWDHPPARQPIPVEKNAQAALRLAGEGAVLLRNEKQFLPLKPGSFHSLVLIGPGALAAVTGGGGSSRVKPAVHPVTPIDGFKTRLGAGVAATLYSGSDPALAAAAGRSADIAIVMVRDWQTEGRDHDLALSGSFGSQDAIVEAVAAANPRTIVVAKTGGPLLMPWAGKVPAILEVWYPGEEDAAVVPALLMGDINPSGKLPITFPKSIADLPAHTPEQYPGVGGIAKYSEGVMVGYRWYDQQKIDPLYPFGYGMSYSTFGYSNLKLSATQLTTAAPRLAIDFDITNQSGPAGVEIAQVYLALPSLDGIPQPPRQLKAFARLSIPAGARQHAHVTLDPRAFSYWDVKSHAWKIAPGDYAISIGASSRDLRLQGKITLE
jgi:beta-glucosidase